MIGLMVMSVAGLGLGTFNANIMTEQSLGTMEVLLATPTPLPVLLAGSFVFPLLLTRARHRRVPRRRRSASSATG